MPLVNMWVFVLFGLFCVAEGSSPIYDSRTCGRLPAPVQRFIRRGEEVISGELPWSVGLWYNPEGIIEGRCSGTLVSKTHVLTAAHCFANLSRLHPHDYSEYQVVLAGMCSTGCQKPSQYYRQIKSISLMDQYTPHAEKKNDIALVELDEPVPKSVHHICLPTFNFHINKKYDDVFVSGVGKRFDGTSNGRLMKVLLGKRYDGPDFVKRVPRGEFLVMSDNQKAFCTGDSGAGGTSKIDGRNVLVGISSRSTCYDGAKWEAQSSNYFTDVVSRLATIQTAMKIRIQ